MTFTSRDRRLDDLRRENLTALDAAIPADRAVALVDYPNQYNCGDCAIWMGEIAALHALNRRVAYVADHQSFSVRTLDALAPEATILVHGGGNLGDLYPSHQRVRDLLARDCRHHRVVHLPQTIHFDDKEAERRAAQSISSHPDSLLFARDEVSYGRAARYGVACALAPDSAFALTSLRRLRHEGRGTLWLMRRDVERRHAEESFAHTWTEDWPREPRHVALARRIPRLTYARRGGLTAASRTKLMKRLFDGLAESRVWVSVRLLSRAERVITDRLHAHILCTLLGIPHVLLDNSYGKNRAFYDTWSSGFGIASFAANSSDAQTLVRDLPVQPSY